MKTDESSQQPPRLRVLVVDDNRDAADTLAHMVRLWGHDCVCVYEPMQAFEVVVVRQPDVVLADIAMPAVNGFALARLIRGQPGMKQPTLVAVSGYADADHQMEAGAAGFDHYVVKAAPLARLRTLLSEQRLAA